MTNLSRITAKIFGETATTTGDDPEIGQFGSALAGTYVGTADVATIQSLPAWSNGFIDSVTPSTQFPPLPEVTGFGKVLSYQNAYLLQKGIAEWDSTTVYYTTSYCQHNDALYRSKINNNVGNEPVANVSNDYWQFLGKDFLNTQQITNCLLEVPQRVKYTLVDGALTILAGSVIIVPYGTTDLSSTYPVGATFINDDLKVYDTCWDSTNNQFFVWAELQSDVVRASSAGGTVAIRTIALYISDSDLILTNFLNTESVSSDSSASATSLFYNTTSNLVKGKSSGTIDPRTGSFPIMKTITNATYNVSAIKQVFNGFGYIGSVIWADKGIKYLRPNGKNADGTLNNIEATTDKLMLLNLSSLANTYQILVFDENNILGHTLGYYNPETNSWFSPNYSNAHWCGIGSFTLSSGAITGATFDGALNINSMCDGQWVGSSLVLASNVSSPTTTEIEYDLSSYLPNDGYNYEVMFSGTIHTGTTSGNQCHLDLKSSMMPSSVHLCGINTRTSYMRCDGNTTIPVGADRKITCAHYSSNTGVFYLWALAYRRIGTNF